MRDTGPEAMTVWPQNKAGKLPKSLPALGATSHDSSWKIPYTADYVLIMRAEPRGIGQISNIHYGKSRAHISGSGRDIELALACR